MKLLKPFVRSESAAPLLALVFASGVCAVFVIARIVWSGNRNYAFLLWNLFLAWLPLILAMLAREQPHDGPRPGWRLAVLSCAWLLFFPNAPYIFTDLIHLTTQWYVAQFWADIALFLMCAMTGLVLGFLSLYLIQSIVARMYGRTAGWLFVALASGLGSFGTFIGRFLRFNSWDALVKPGKIYEGLGAWTSTDLYNQAPAMFPALFAVFLFTTYLMLYALTRLSPGKTEAVGTEESRTDAPTIGASQDA